jgi:hypothetical protein
VGGRETKRRIHSPTTGKQKRWPTKMSYPVGLSYLKLVPDVPRDGDGGEVVWVVICSVVVCVALLE